MSDESDPRLEQRGDTRGTFASWIRKTLTNLENELLRVEAKFDEHAKASLKSGLLDDDPEGHIQDHVRLRVAQAEQDRVNTAKEIIDKERKELYLTAKKTLLTAAIGGGIALLGWVGGVFELGAKAKVDAVIAHSAKRISEDKPYSEPDPRETPLPVRPVHLGRSEP